MYFKQQKIKSFFLSLFVLFSLSGNLVFQAKAQDLVSFSDINLSSSVFIFRGSSRKMQLNSSSDQYVLRNLNSRKFFKSKGKKTKTYRPKQKNTLKIRRKITKKVSTSKRTGSKAIGQKTLQKRRILAKTGKPKNLKSTNSAAPAVEPIFDRAVENYNQGRYHEAVADYQKVIAIDATHPDAHANLAAAYRQLGKYAEANGAYKTATEYLTDDTDLFSEWGFCLGKTEEWNKAVERLNTAKDLASDAINFANLGWAYLNAGRMESNTNSKSAAQKNYTLSKEILLKAVEMNPQLSAAFLNLGIVYRELSEYANSVEMLNKANKLNENWLIAVNELGKTYRRANRLPEAIRQFQKVINLDGKLASAYYDLGEAQYKSGRKKEARKTLNTLKLINPDIAEKLNKLLKG